MIVVVHVFGRPRWTYDQQDDWQSAAIFPQWEVSFVPNTVGVFINLICLLTLGFGVGLEFTYEYSTSRKYFLYVFAAGVALKLMEAFADFMSFCLTIKPMFTVSPIEGVFILLVEKAYFQKILYLARTVPMFAILLVVLGAVMLSFEALAFLIFNPQGPEGVEYFGDWGSGMWNMLMVRGINMLPFNEFQFLHYHLSLSAHCVRVDILHAERY